MNNKGDLISREALKEAFRKDIMGGLNWKSIIDNAPTVPLPNEQIAWEQGYEAGLVQGKHDNAPTVEPFTQLEKEEIADAITYLLDAELLEENGYTEEVIKALKSALKKVGGAE